MDFSTFYIPLSEPIVNIAKKPSIPRRILNFFFSFLIVVVIFIAALLISSIIFILYLGLAGSKLDAHYCPFYDGSPLQENLSPSWWCFHERECDRLDQFGVNTPHDIVKYMVCKPNESLFFSMLPLFVVSLFFHVITIPIVVLHYRKKRESKRMKECESAHLSTVSTNTATDQHMVHDFFGFMQDER